MILSFAKFKKWLFYKFEDILVKLGLAVTYIVFRGRAELHNRREGHVIKPSPQEKGE